MFEDFEFEEKFNPWDVKSIEDFRFYCCPECSTRNVHRSDFIRHAVTFHPNSKIIIEKLEDNKDDVKPIVTKLTKTESIDDSTETITNSTNEATPISNNSGTEPENVPSVTKDDVTVGTEKKSTVTLSYTSDDSSNSSDDEETLIETPVQTNVIKENISPAIANHNLNQSNLPTTSDLTKSTESDTIDSNEVTSIIYSPNASEDEETCIETPKQTYTMIQENISPATENSNFNQSNLPSTSEVTKSTETDTIGDNDSNEATSIINSPNTSKDEEPCHEPATFQPSEELQENISPNTGANIDSSNSFLKLPQIEYLSTIDKYIYLPSTLKVNENVRHKCKQCEKSFPFNSDLIKSLEHIKHAHGIDIGYSCEKCELSFKNKHHLRTHIKTVHEEKHDNVRYKCDKCDKSFSVKSYLKEHIKHVHESFRYNCDKCDKSFSKKRILFEHNKSVHENIQYDCHKCDKSFSLKNSLRAHIRSVHDNVRYSCDICDKKFPFKSGVRIHIKTVHEKHVQYCEKCDKSFLNLRQHIMTTHSNVKYKCDQCDKSFPLKTHLNRHIKSVHENVRFKCDKCDKSYPWKSQLIRHIKIVHAKFKD